MGAKARPRAVHLRARLVEPPDWWPTADGEPAWVYIHDDAWCWSTVPDAGFRINASEVDEVRAFFVRQYDHEETAHWRWEFRVETIR